MTSVTRREAGGEAAASGPYCADDTSPPEVFPRSSKRNSTRLQPDWAKPPEAFTPSDSGNPRELTVLEAGVAISGLLARCRSAVTARHLEIASAVWRLEHVIGAYAPYAPEDGEVELVAGPSNVRRLLADIADLPASSRLTLLDEPVPTSGLTGLLTSSALAARGVALRTVYQQDSRPPYAQHRYLRLLAAAGVQARRAPLIPINMIIIDGATVVLPVDPDRPGTGAAVVRNTAWAHLARLIFDDCWNRATAPDR